MLIDVYIHVKKELHWKALICTSLSDKNRSMIPSLSLSFHAVYIRCSDAQSEATLRRFSELIVTLGSGAAVSISSGNSLIPPGCAMSTVSARCEVHMMLKVRV